MDVNIKAHQNMDKSVYIEVVQKSNIGSSIGSFVSNKLRENIRQEVIFIVSIIKSTYIFKVTLNNYS